jgi:hypothetical protein
MGREFVLSLAVGASIAFPETPRAMPARGAPKGTAVLKPLTETQKKTLTRMFDECHRTNDTDRTHRHPAVLRAIREISRPRPANPQAFLAQIEARVYASLKAGGHR